VPRARSLSAERSTLRLRRRRSSTGVRSRFTGASSAVEHRIS
jgi:hypothetical protein